MRELRETPMKLGCADRETREMREMWDRPWNGGVGSVFKLTQRRKGAKGSGQGKKVRRCLMVFIFIRSRGRMVLGYSGLLWVTVARWQKQSEEAGRSIGFLKMWYKVVHSLISNGLRVLNVVQKWYTQGEVVQGKWILNR